MSSQAAELKEMVHVLVDIIGNIDHNGAYGSHTSPKRPIYNKILIMVGIQNKVIRVGVGDMRASNDPESVIVTFSLGSCLGIVIYDPVVRIGGLLHAMLPESNGNMSGPGFNPFKFIDTGVPLLFKETYKFGAQKHRMKIAVAGGSQILDDSGFFNIGQRNITALKKIFWKNGVMIDKEHIGGTVSRTVRFTLSTGEIMLRLGSGKEIIL